MAKSGILTILGGPGTPRRGIPGPGVPGPRDPGSGVPGSRDPGSRDPGPRDPGRTLPKKGAHGALFCQKSPKSSFLEQKK